MKKTVLLLTALAAGSAAYAQAPAPAPEAQSSYSVTVDFPYVSKYVFRGIKLADDSIQPSIEIASGDFYAGVWTSQPVTSNIDNEFDFYVGYGIPLNDSWKIDTGVTMYYYPELDASSGLDRDTYEGYVGLTGTAGGFTPGVYAYYDFTLEALTLQGSVGYSVPLESAGASLDFSATYGYVDGDGFSYAYWGLGAVIPYKLTEKATASVGVQYASNDLDGADDDHVWFTAGLTVGF